MSFSLLTRSSALRSQPILGCCRSFSQRSSPLLQQSRQSSQPSASEKRTQKSSTQQVSSTKGSTTTTTATATEAAQKPNWFKITLVRSAIGLHPTVRATVTALGFKRRMQTIYLRVDPKAIGKILKVKELVKLETVTEAQKREETKRRIRSHNRGYTIVENVL